MEVNRLPKAEMSQEWKCYQTALRVVYFFNRICKWMYTMDLLDKVGSTTHCFRGRCLIGEMLMQYFACSYTHTEVLDQLFDKPTKAWIHWFLCIEGISPFRGISWPSAFPCSPKCPKTCCYWGEMGIPWNSRRQSDGCNWKGDQWKLCPPSILGNFSTGSKPLDKASFRNTCSVLINGVLVVLALTCISSFF